MSDENTTPTHNRFISRQIHDEAITSASSMMSQSSRTEQTSSVPGDMHQPSQPGHVPSSSKAITKITKKPATNFKRSRDMIAHTDRGPKRGRKKTQNIVVALADTTVRSGQTMVDCPVYKHHIMHDTTPPCQGCSASTMSQVRSHLSRNYAQTHRVFPTYIRQCYRCKQDFVERESYNTHRIANDCVLQPQSRGDLTIPWSRQYLALYPDAMRIPLPWSNMMGWLPESIWELCLSLQTPSMSSSQFSKARCSPPLPATSLMDEQYHEGVFENVLRHTASPLRSGTLENEESSWQDESDKMPDIILNMYELSQQQSVLHMETPARFDTSEHHPTSMPLSITDQHSTSSHPPNYEIAYARAERTSRERAESVIQSLPSDSGYQSAAGTDIGSFLSDSLAGNLSPDFLYDFIAYFGNTLIEKTGAQQWAQFAVAHHAQEAIQDRLTVLLRDFAIDVETSPSNLASPDSTMRQALQKDTVQGSLNNAVQLIRLYRPHIARYFVEHSITTTAGAVSLSDHLQGLGRHLSLRERVGLLVRHEGTEKESTEKSSMHHESENEIIDLENDAILAQLGSVQAILVSSDAFQMLASELRRSFYRNDTYGMDTIQQAVLGSIHTISHKHLVANIVVSWDVAGFMQSQYDKIIPLASVVVLTGSAVYAQATTCGEYVQTHWPLIGSIVLDKLDRAIDRAGEEFRTSDLDYAPVLRICVRHDRTLHISIDKPTENVLVELAQIFAWLGSALSNSPFGEDLAYGVPAVAITDRETYTNKSTEHDIIQLDLDITFQHLQLHHTEAACWLPLFTGMTIVTGFPIRGRSNEIGLEIPLQLLAAFAGVCHATEFNGGIVMKSFCHMFVPVQKTADRVQWHAVGSANNNMYLDYHDALDRCERRASVREVSLDDLRTTRAFLGWCSIATSQFGASTANYEDINYSGTHEASASVHFTGTQFGFQQWATLSANFTIGALQTKHYIKCSGPYRRIMSIAERVPVVLYDTQERRGYLVSATDVMLHVFQHRQSLDPFEVDNETILVDTNVPVGSSARKTLIRNENVELSDKGEHTFKEEIHNIWSILEDLRAKTVKRDQDTQGTEIKGPYREYLRGYEFKAVVQERGSYTLMEKELNGTHGGWPLLVRDIKALVLLASGFGDLILPSNEDKITLCGSWQKVPSGLDCLATTCRMLKDLYDVAGGRLNRKYLTTNRLQWHQGKSCLFAPCVSTTDCQCNRLQQIRSSGTVVPPDAIIDGGAVIFGDHRSPFGALRFLFSSSRKEETQKSGLYHHTNGAIQPIDSRDLLDNKLHRISANKSALEATITSQNTDVSTCAIRPVKDTLPNTLESETATGPLLLGKKRVLVPDSLSSDIEHHEQSRFSSEDVPLLKRKKPFRVGGMNEHESVFGKTGQPVWGS